MYKESYILYDGRMLFTYNGLRWFTLDADDVQKKVKPEELEKLKKDAAYKM